MFTRFLSHQRRPVSDNIMPAPPRPSRLMNRPPAQPRFDEYLDLASKLDIAPLATGRVLQRAVADFLWERDVEMFNYCEVVRYLSAIAEEESNHLCWRPLRNRDIPTVTEFDSRGNWGWGEENTHDHYHGNLWACRPYDKAVPFEVLQTVMEVEQKFPGRLHFFVSDISPDPDPFIILTARDMDRIVFGVWDEPAFFKKGSTGGG